MMWKAVDMMLALLCVLFIGGLCLVTAAVMARVVVAMVSGIIEEYAAARIRRRRRRMAERSRAWRRKSA